MASCISTASLHARGGRNCLTVCGQFVCYHHRPSNKTARTNTDESVWGILFCTCLCAFLKSVTISRIFTSFLGPPFQKGRVVRIFVGLAINGTAVLTLCVLNKSVVPCIITASYRSGGTLSTFSHSSALEQYPPLIKQTKEGVASLQKRLGLHCETAFFLHRASLHDQSCTQLSTSEGAHGQQPIQTMHKKPNDHGSSLSLNSAAERF